MTVPHKAVSDQTSNDDKITGSDGAAGEDALSPEDADLLRRKALWAGIPDRIGMPFRRYNLTPQQRKLVADSYRRIRRKLREGDPNLRK